MKPLLLPNGAFKPGLGAEIDWSHPFARKLLVCVPFLGHSRWTNGSPMNDVIDVIWGSVARRLVALHHSGNPYGSNRDGVCVVAGEDSTIVIPTDPLPAARVTICLVRRKRDTTHRTGTTFSPGGATVGERASAFLPFSDSVVYWDFGGASGANRLTASGLSFSTTIPEKWVFVAGPRGMAIWQNGVKVSSTGTANPGRTVNPATNFNINGYAAGSATGDVQDFNYFAAYDDEWSDALCRWWSAEPYAHLYRSRGRLLFDFGTLSAVPLQRVTQSVLLYGYNRYADSPPAEDACTGGGTVASGSNPTDGTSIATSNNLHMVFRITVDGVTYDFSKTAINWGREKQPRVDKYGPFRRSLMDDQGGIELPSVWVDFIDHDNLMRGWHEDETLHGLTGQFLLADEATWQAGGANAQVRFSGVVTDFRPLPNQKYRLELEGPLAHAFALGKEMQLPRDTLSVVDGTADQGLRRAPARALYGSLSEEGGAIELPFIGTQTPVGHPELGNRHRHFFQRGALGDITAVFRGDPLSGDPPTQRTAAPESEYEGDILAPHISPAWYESTNYLVVDSNRWTFLDLEQTHPAANVSRYGRIPLTANVCGRETTGDGTGSTISSAPRQLVHALNNELLSVVGDANWASQATRNGFSIIDTASAEAVKTVGDALVGGDGLIGAFELGHSYKFITAREFLKQAYLSWGIETFINRFGQVAFTMLDTSATGSGVPHDTAVHDILKGSFHIDPRRDDIENATRYVYRRNYVKALQQLDNPEGTRLPREPFDSDFLSGVQEINDSASITALGGTPRGRRESDVLQMELTRAEAVADAVMGLRNALRCPANGRAQASYAVMIQKLDNAELGSLRKVTHKWGTGTSGYTARRCQLRAIEEDWNQMVARLTLLDVDDLLA